MERSTEPDVNVKQCITKKKTTNFGYTSMKHISFVDIC